MSVARTWAVALTGLRGEVVEVEADVTAHQPDIRIIGLADRALGEAARRVGNACENSGLPLPYRRLTVNLSPAGLPKQGTGFDLAKVCLWHVLSVIPRCRLRTAIAARPRGD
ncbi:magnesium chelatase domain-containing protein [Microbacterium oryzae]|uniref:magnesium chelatase domain-containing protein n=1 Tax=Microbacterium oryzae TaxID=743009 RepID=UPI0025B0B995|nr:magnesium chelatase domain-containing protein [Microbacterium oryzae]MDN3310547.1 magnesium chelatase domain-containing protein [Microbacterium oryzae]